MKIKILIDYLRNLFIKNQTKQTKIYLFGLLIEDLIAKIPEIRLVDFNNCEESISVSLVSIKNKELYHMVLVLFFKDTSVTVHINKEIEQKDNGVNYVNIATFTDYLNNKTYSIERIRDILVKQQCIKKEKEFSNIFNKRDILINNIFIIEKYFNNLFDVLKTVGYNIVIDKVIESDELAKLFFDVTKDNSHYYISIKITFDNGRITTLTNRNERLPFSTYHLSDRLTNIREVMKEVTNLLNEYVTKTGEKN